MFSDDTKLYRPVRSIDACQQLQSDRNNLAVWSSKWLLKCNETKCVILRIKHSLDFIYCLNGFPLREVPYQNDLGVIVSNNLLPHEHIQSITKKSNQRIGLIRRCFTDITVNKVEILFNSLIRPILEYGSPAWAPWYSKDIANLEKVQLRTYVTKYVTPLTLYLNHLYIFMQNNNYIAQSLTIAKMYPRSP